MHRITIALALCLVFIAPALAGPLPTALAPLAFLLGEWEGGGGGVPGQSAGGTTFAPSLQDRVIIRTNFAVTPKTEKTPASRHDDLMIIYADEKGMARADYYDNEGHVIRYEVHSTGQGQVEFTSAASAGAPRFRLTYRALPNGEVAGSFSTAAPATPEAFSPYLTWTMRRTGR